MSLRRKVWGIIAVAKPGDRGSRYFDIFILSLIFLNVLAVILSSVQFYLEQWEVFFDVFERFSVFVFSIEYLFRIWSCVEDPRFQEPVFGRFRFSMQIMPVIDLLAILPFYLPLFGFEDNRSLRVFRLLRLLRIAKGGRYFVSVRLIGNVVQSKKEELVLAFGMVLMLLIVSSSLLYACENEVQPDVFSSIPATMWWAIATLTTVGYGDMYPITVMGKVMASITAVFGIGLFALPAGMLGAGFVEEIQKRRQMERSCPHCGKTIP